MKTIALTALVALGILIPLTCVPAQRSDAAVDQLPPVPIRLVDTLGTVVADPDSVSVKRGQRLEWTSEDGDWEVTFHSDEPFGNGPDSRVISGKKGQTKGRPIQALAKFGSYKYDIQITRPDGTVLTADPEIVVERDDEMEEM